MNTSSLSPSGARKAAMTALDFPKRKKNNQKIAMVTCYDSTFAKIVGATDVDCVLVGDSCAMVTYGEGTTIRSNVATIARHTEAVRKGLPEGFIVADLPFLSYRKGLIRAVEAAGTLIRAGANAVKLEGLDGNERAIAHFVESGIPVMGHLGLTPQSYHALGGYRVQGRGEGAAGKIKADALRLQELGCFSLVLECVPEPLGGDVSRSLGIPVIGIGSGREVDGQVLVLQDLLGLSGFKPRFARRYLEGEALVASALNDYCRDVASGSFPAEGEAYAS